MRRGFNHNILCRRIDSSKLTGQSLDEIVDHLRSNYPDYTRLQRKPFSNNVKQALQMQQKRKQPASTSNAEKHNDDEDIDSTTPIKIRTRKKSRQNDEREEQLCRTETEYLRRIRRVQNSPSPSTSGSSSSGETSGEEGESADSLTSEDAIFGAKVEPEVDLMKSMLRLQYSGNKSEFKFAEEKNLEVDVDNKAKKMDIVKVGGSKGKLKRESTDSKNTEGSETKGGDTCGVKGGPRFEDLGGIKGILDDLYMDVIAPLYHSQVSQWLGIKPLAGILLHGPPGCGKTKLAHAIANEAGVPFYKISATEVVSGVSGASEENIRELFTKAYRTAPSIVFIDEIDAIASKRENLQREMERRIVTQLLTCMDDSSQIKSSAEGDLGSEKPGYVLVIGATNRPDALDPALRRPGRFDREITLGIPDEKARAEILSVLVCKLRLESGGAFDIEKIARSTAGFVGADLEALVNKAGNLAMRRIFSSRKVNNEDWLKQPFSDDEVETLAISMTDFEEAVKVVQPSLRREGFSTIPNVKWEDVGGLDDLRKEFDRYIVSRIKDPEDYEDFGVNMETGFLLYGPPGCGKTLIAKAVANEAGANFIHIKGPELLNKYVGESELNVRTIFRRARTCSPCIIFFDEVDAVTMKRGKEGAWVVERLFTQLLIELDGADQRRGVFVIGATNRPEVMDEAILRPGRLGKLMYVPLPDSNQRGLILKALARKKPICPDVDLISIGQNEATENYSGADLAQVMNDAAIVALEEKRMLGEGSYIIKDWDIKKDHIDQALEKVVPSVSTQQRKEYDALSTKLQGKGRLIKEPNACVDCSELLHLFQSS